MTWQHWVSQLVTTLQHLVFQLWPFCTEVSIWSRGSYVRTPCATAFWGSTLCLHQKDTWGDVKQGVKSENLTAVFNGVTAILHCYIHSLVVDGAALLAMTSHKLRWADRGHYCTQDSPSSEMLIHKLLGTIFPLSWLKALRFQAGLVAQCILWI